MDKKDLQKKLSQTYSTENWQEIVKFVFPNVSLREKPAVLDVEARFQDIVESFKQLGDVRLHDGKTLALLELKVKENVNLIRNRVRLNEVVSSVIDTENANGVLSIFEKGTDDYRFTFSARGSEFDEEGGDFVTTKTDTKRFTYVLGKNESCKTPAQRFYDLSEHKDKADIKAIEDAFSVEKLSKLFFKEYKDQYNAFVNYMMQTPSIFTAIYSNDDKAIRDFVKILLGRIIFIKFVQKKGWMGVDAASKKWIDGDYRFLENGFAYFKHQDLFYSTFLEPLFDALDEPNRPNDIFAVTNSRVPYLSGGLFELEDKKTKNINFPAKYFNDLFEFLDRYNFTIDENDTNDHEVGIDPEMLGHIFENLLEDNKDKGAFYTPKEIVRYMCQESLKEYLKTSLQNNKQWPTDATEAAAFEQALHNFVTKKEAGGIIEFEETIARALKDVKICDPAIGSGAFPMGLLNEIFQLVHKLHDANKDKVERVWELQGWQPNLVKQNIIQNSIYGVDIEKGAVDVARLRFWLSLIVDEPEPKALPHLEYKIVVGNSLVSKLDQTIIDIDWEVQNNNSFVETDLFGKPKPKQFNAFEVENDEKQKQLLKEISAKQKLVFDPNSDEEKLSLEIRNLKIDLLVNQLDAMVKTKGVIAKPIGTGKNIKAQTELWLETIGWKQQIEKLQKLRKDTKGVLHFFDWKLDFPEIMNEQVTDKVGFDIVIGNPPYISAVTMSRDIETKNYFKKIFPTATGSYDLYLLFILLGSKLSSQNGNYSWIIPNKFLVSDYAKKSIEILKENFGLKHAINVSKFNVFEGIGVYPIIVNGIKGNKYIFNEYFLEKYSNLELRFFENPTKINDHSLLKDFDLKINSGATGFQAQQIKPYVKSKKTSDSIPFSVSGSVDRYTCDNIKVRYMGDLYDQAYIIKNDFVSNSKWNFWNLPKIVIAGMTKEIEAVYIDTPLALGVGIYGIYDFKMFEPYSLTAILNSKYLTYYFRHKFKHKHLAGGYLAINKSTIEEFPLVKTPKEVENKLTQLSKSIHSNKTLLLETNDLEQQIDNLVYKLYELTYDEVLVVEPEFSERMSREEYEGLKVE